MKITMCCVGIKSVCVSLTAVYFWSSPFKLYLDPFLLLLW